MLRTTRMLTRYNAWANTTMFEALDRLPDGEAEKPRRSLFKNMVHTMNHNYVIGLIFRAHLEARPHGFSTRNTSDYPPLGELRRKQRILDDWYIDWSDVTSDAALDERIAFTFVDGGVGAMTRAEMALHVVHHATYHRGFVAQMFYDVPAKPPVTDLTVFRRDVPLQLN